uniref:Retroviral polymerase SH3-like domain-containing protein n=1 Tax=Physcomitrium patens TaxID=3218 RepID=A0A2K1JS83_PHYPA|nr:hypothetical protein PHYPA_016772 [Physcomitrium patens]
MPLCISPLVSQKSWRSASVVRCVCVRLIVRLSDDSRTVDEELEVLQTMRSNSKPENSKAIQILELVHFNICGPKQEGSYLRCIYFIRFIDDLIRYFQVYLMKYKFEVFEKFTLNKNFVKKQTSFKFKTLRSNSGGEYKSNEIFDWKIYTFISKETKKKLDSHSKEAIFLGYSEESKAYRLVNIQNQKILISKNILFNKNLYDSKAKYLPKDNKELLLDLELFKHPITIIRTNEQNILLV